jgi:O-antigen ligase
VAPFASSNELSAAGAIIATFVIAQLLVASTPKARVWWTLGLVSALFGTILAAGRQGVIMLLASTLVLLWFRQRKLFFGALAPALIVLVWFGGDSVFRIFSRGQPGLLTNFTGRLPWWQAALEAWGQHPWTGYGYCVGGRFVSLSDIGRSDVSNLHNGYLEALIGVGLIGVIPLLLAVGLVVSWSTGSLRRGQYVPVAILAFPVVIHTFIDLGFGGWLKPDFVLLACLAALSDWRRSTGDPLPPKVDWQTSDGRTRARVPELR